MTTGPTEQTPQAQIRLEASRLGNHLMRNNNGAAQDKTGRVIRYGLGNDSKQINKVLKFPDLIGFTPRLITQADVGKVLGVFTGIEVKRPGWKFANTEHERAQLAALNLIAQSGGIAGFAQSVEDYLMIHEGSISR